MAKEIGISKGAPPWLKKKDDKLDKSAGTKEGSVKDLKVDAQAMKDYLNKPIPKVLQKAAIKAQAAKGPKKPVRRPR
jgi:hypothetical protein